jgi:hypothetical protein
MTHITVDIKNLRRQHRMVSEYQRKTGAVAAHYTGMGPNKRVPNVPKVRLDEWLLAHGATKDQLTAIYFVTLKEEVKTHDLINRGLLKVDNYLAALNATKG